MPTDEEISNLTAASALDGTELVPVVQSGVTVKTTAQAIADLGGGAADLSAIAEDVLPATDNTYDLGSLDLAFRKIFAHDVYVVGAGDILTIASSGFDVARPDATSETPEDLFTGEGNFFTSLIQVSSSPWWDGAASVPAYGGIGTISSNTDPHFKLVFVMNDDGNNDSDSNIYMDSNHQFYPKSDGVGSLGIDGKTWGGIYATLPTTTDPAKDGELFTCTAAELAALLDAGAKHVLMSKGAP